MQESVQNPILNIRHSSFVIRNSRSVLYGLLSVLLLLACQLPQAAAPPPTPTTASAATPLPSSGSAAQPAGTPRPLSLRPVTPWPLWSPLPPAALNDSSPIEGRLIFDPSLVTIANPAALPALSDEQRRQLIQNGLLILADRPDEPAVLLDRQLRSGEPLWIGADHVVWRTQAIQNQIIRHVEVNQITPLLGRFLTVLAQATAGQHAASIAAEDHIGSEAARRNLAYLTLAARLLDPAFPIDPLVADLVQSELDLIALGGSFQSPYSGRTVDYQPWLTTSDPLDRSRRWLGTVPLVSWDAGIVDSTLEGRQSQLLLAALAQNREAADLWPRLYRLEQYLNGGQTDETVWRQLQRLSPVDTDLADFVKTIKTAGSPPLFLLPPPHSWQSFVFDQLTFNQVGLYSGSAPPPATAADTAIGLVRLYPHPLDLAIVQGSVAARQQLDDGHHTTFERYDQQLAAVQLSFGDQLPGWERLSWAAVAPLLNNDQTNGRRLALWQQAALDRPDGWVQVFPPADPVIYIEPAPLLYSQLSAVTFHLRQTLARYGGIDPESAALLDQLAQELVDLAAVVRLQQSGRPLSPQDEQALQKWLGAPPAGSLPRPIRYYPSEPDAVFSIDAAVPLLALVPLNGRPTVVGGWTFVSELDLPTREN